jgi:two-component system response regulator (stage 0 sporulation protein F)
MAKILIVDDDDNQRLLYREALEEEGFEVVEARDGSAALASIQRSRPDVVVLDINMPEMDGLQTLAHIHDRDRKLPVIINSAYAAYKNRYTSWIADAYVIKSSNLDDLKRAVLQVVNDACDES